MNLLQDILNTNNGQLAKQLGEQFGLSETAAKAAMSSLIPAIAGGVKKASQSPTAIQDLVSKLQNNKELRDIISAPEIASQASVKDNGNDILGTIFGSKDVSRTVADKAAQNTGIDIGALKGMLPIIAGVVMSKLNQKSEAAPDMGGLGDLLSGLGGLAGGASNSGLGSLIGGLIGKSAPQKSSGLESLLDFDGDGDVSDDIMNMVKKLF